MMTVHEIADAPTMTTPSVTDVNIEDHAPTPKEPTPKTEACAVVNGWPWDGHPLIQCILYERGNVERALRFHLEHKYDGGAEPEPGFGWSAHLGELCARFIQVDQRLDEARAAAYNQDKHELENKFPPLGLDPQNEVDPGLLAVGAFVPPVSARSETDRELVTDAREGSL